jgi:hypothetical protein
MVLWEKESGAGERRPEVLATADERERESNATQSTPTRDATNQLETLYAMHDATLQVRYTTMIDG